jgi:hypothetical protein
MMPAVEFRFNARLRLALRRLAVRLKGARGEPRIDPGAFWGILDAF